MWCHGDWSHVSRTAADDNAVRSSNPSKQLHALATERRSLSDGKPAVRTVLGPHMTLRSETIRVMAVPLRPFQEAFQSTDSHASSMSQPKRVIFAVSASLPATGHNLKTASVALHSNWTSKHNHVSILHHTAVAGGLLSDSPRLVGAAISRTPSVRRAAGLEGSEQHCERRVL
ncbi:hypothetical protein LIA77_03200 [Sarocladium implicatum]|nr:hypothetical protein LIA77_03200 [Sarocladium implicatum]